MRIAAWALILIILGTRPVCSRYEDDSGHATLDIDAAGGFKTAHLMRKDTSDSLGSLGPSNNQMYKRSSGKGISYNIGPHATYETLAQAAVTDKFEWSPWFSWNTPGRSSNHNHNPVRAMLCLNTMCNNMSLERNVNLPTWGTTRTSIHHDIHQTQNDTSRKLHCPDGRVATALSCATARCERMDLTCSEPKGWQLDSNQEAQTVEFSQELGGMSQCDPSFYVYGLSCAQAGCQTKTLYCKKKKKP